MGRAHRDAFHYQRVPLENHIVSSVLLVAHLPDDIYMRGIARGHTSDKPVEPESPGNAVGSITPNFLPPPRVAVCKHASNSAIALASDSGFFARGRLAIVRFLGAPRQLLSHLVWARAVPLCRLQGRCLLRRASVFAYQIECAQSQLEWPPSKA